MFSSRHFISNVNDVPSNWIFENYLGLGESLTGQNVRIHSLFNPHDRTPSMYLFYSSDSETYRYKCFSTGKGGSAVELMMHLWNMPFTDAFKRIREDYVAYLKSGKVCETKIVEHSRWKVGSYKTRKWNKDDAQYWSAYNISSKLLEKYNVLPLEGYTMQKTASDKSVEQEFDIVRKRIYGYFTNEGILYKIYQPENRERKFIKVCDYTQGYDQLEEHPYLVIASSLKDAMVIKSMGLQVDVIAPDSENTMFSEGEIEEYKILYKAIVTIFDSDQAGIRSMCAYRDKYNIPFVYLPQEKDIADISKVHGIAYAFQEFVPKLHYALDKYKNIMSAV